MTEIEHAQWIRQFWKDKLDEIKGTDRITTGVLDKNGIEISVGDIVHYRGEGLCAHGEVVEDDYYGFAILDDRPKTKGRRYSLKNEGIYRIEERR